MLTDYKTDECSFKLPQELSGFVDKKYNRYVFLACEKSNLNSLIKLFYVCRLGSLSIFANLINCCKNVRSKLRELVQLFTSSTLLRFIWIIMRVHVNLFHFNCYLLLHDLQFYEITFM